MLRRYRGWQAAHLPVTPFCRGLDSGLLDGRAVVLSRWRGRGLTQGIGKVNNERVKGLVHDGTSSTNDRGSSAPKLLETDDPLLHRGRGGLRPVLQQVTRATGPGTYSQVSASPRR